MGRKGMKSFLKSVSHAPAGDEPTQPTQPDAPAPASIHPPSPKAKSKASKASAFLASPVKSVNEMVPEVEEDEDADSTQESRSQMLQRHKRETLAHKKAMGRLGKSKKDEVARLTAEMDSRHLHELSKLEEAESTARSGPEAVADVTPALAAMSTNEPSSKKGSKAQKRREKRAQEEAEREARIAEERAAAGPSQGQVEETRLAALLAPQNLRIREIRADGHCLYRAIEDQLRQADPGSSPLDYLRLRRLAAAHIRLHADDYLPFLAGAGEEDEEERGEEDLGAKLEEHCQKVEATASWGGQMELRALASALHRHIRVYAVGMPAVEMGEENEEGGSPLQLCYLRHAFGLGEHYNSVEPVEDEGGSGSDFDDEDEK